jgi:hypothetical protein
MKIILYILGALGLAGIAYYIYMQYAKPLTAPQPNATIAATAANATSAYTPVSLIDAMSSYPHTTVIPIKLSPSLNALAGGSFTAPPQMSAVTTGTKGNVSIQAMPVLVKQAVPSPQPAQTTKQAQPPTKATPSPVNQPKTTVSPATQTGSSKTNTAHSVPNVAPVGAVTTPPAPVKGSGGMTHTTTVKTITPKAA